MNRRLAVALALLLSACGSPARDTLSGRSLIPTPAVTASPMPSAVASPASYAASAVRVVVNGIERPYGTAIAVEGVGGTTVRLVFPFPVDRTSVDPWLPRTGSPVWIDDTTVELKFPETEPNPGFKIPQITSTDGLSRIDLLIVALRYLPSVALSVYSLAGATAPSGPNASGSWRVPGGPIFAISPDGSRVLFYPVIAGSDPAHVFDLATRTSTDLKIPKESAPYVAGSWLGDGRVVLVGSSVWVGRPEQPFARIADISQVQPLNAAPSPGGSYVAIAGAQAVWLFSLRDGSARALTGSSGGCARGFAWSQDERLLASIDCETLSVRITDTATSRIVRIIDGVANSLAGLPTGDFIVTRDSGQQGEGARSLGVVYSFAGTEKARYLGYAWSISADGRYLLNIGSCCAGGQSSSLVDLRTPDAQPVGLPGIASWTADGRIVVTSFTRS